MKWPAEPPINASGPETMHPDAIRQMGRRMKSFLASNMVWRHLCGRCLLLYEQAMRQVPFVRENVCN